MSDDLDEDFDLPTYLKVNVSTELPSLIRQAAIKTGLANNSDWVRHVIIDELVRVGVVAVDEAQALRERQPHWGNGKGATSPEFIARRYGRPWPPESAEADNKSSVEVGQDG